MDQAHTMEKRSVEVDRVPWQRFIALALTFLLPIHVGVPVASSVLSWGVLLSVPLLPVIVRSFRAFRGTTVLISIASVALVSGVLLTAIARQDHLVNTSYLWVTMGSVASAVFVILPTLLWARTRVSIRTTAMAFAAGLVVQTLATPDSWDGNVWKFGLSFPVAVFLLALVWGAKTSAPAVAVLALVGTLAILSGDRSYFGFVAVVIIMMFLPRARTRPTKLKSLAAVVALVAAGAAVYSIGVSLALSGFLGERNQTVTASQLRASGSVLTAGRSESGAALQLFAHRPLGYGPGVLPTTGDVAIGQQGLAGRGLDLTGQYVREYLFGTGFKLHSITSDLWVNFGLGGLAFAAALAAICVGALVISITRTRPRPLILLLGTVALWNLAFSPIGSNLIDTVFCVALLLPFTRSSSGVNDLGRGTAVDAVNDPGEPALR
jgi:hypothetical protein